MLPGDRVRNWLLGFLAVAAGFALLYWAQTVFKLLFLAAFVAAMISPALRRLNRVFPAWLSLGSVILGMAVVLVFGAILVASAAVDVAERGPRYAPKLQEKMQHLADVARRVGFDIHARNVKPDRLLQSALGFAGVGIESFPVIVGRSILLLFLVIFLAIETVQFRKKVRAGFGEETGAKIRSSLDAISAQLQKYFLAKGMISVANGLIVYFVCLAAGVDFPVVWGALALLLNWIPNVGAAFALIPPVLLAYLQFETPTRAIVVLAVLLVLQNLLGNLLEPRILGKSVRISALVVFISLIFWGWLWGLLGAVLAVPLTVSVKIVCEHVEALRPVAVLLGCDPVPRAESERTGQSPSNLNV